MSATPATPAREAPRPRPTSRPAAHSPDERAAAGPGERWFALGVAACAAAAAAFLLARITAWPPHEDETLALFVGRDSLGGMLETVHGERGGAPLHFLFAWLVAHAGGGLLGLRLVSAVFAVASLPVVAALSARLAGRRVALVATALAAASWLFLFHGAYARMYSLFLLTSALSYLAFVDASERGGARRWALWAIATLAAIATHPYGALVLATQALFLLARARTRDGLVAFRDGLVAFALVGVAAAPFWYSDLVLAGRFDVGVGGGGEQLGGPFSVLGYLARVAGDASSGFLLVLVPVLILAGLGWWQLRRAQPRAALLTALVIAVPALTLALARLNDSTSPESRHLLFALPFFSTALAAGLVAVLRAKALLVLALAALVAGEVAWAWHKTPPLFEGEPAARVEAREGASAWLAETARPDDVLFGYSPLFLGAWERSRSFSRLVVPRADARLALSALRSARSLGRGVWVLDASDTSNRAPRLTIPLRRPRPESRFEARVFGPFLVIRTRAPTRTPQAFLEASRSVMQVGRSLELDDANVNLLTLERALRKP